jgi:hypothetical protein
LKAFGLQKAIILTSPEGPFEYLIMKRKHLYLLTFFFLFFASCYSWKNALVTKGNRDDAINNAVTDFLKSDHLSKKDTVFAIHIKDINENILGISILGYPDRLLPSSRDKIGTNFPGFPTNYIEKVGKLFYWYDPKKSIDNKIVSILNKYHKIDSLNVKGFVGIPTRLTGDSKKAVDYYFCKCNLKEYKKVTTTLAMGYYKPPKLECSCN